ncbi:methionyl-tRNA formyltransferase [Shouchella shacheensis]|uniref:methionyl-tRNA formyltransferase n=1 Tax=Shouchella shacheensis TaxID=1649580 RepID=UPI000A99127B|nr:methionyl-tRNA formyltransferase [Shouchella shacheensis]
MKIVFMGTPDFSVPILQTLINTYEVLAVVTQPDKPIGRKKVLTAPPVKQEAEKHGIDVLQPDKIRHQYEEILSYQPDVIVTAAYGQILPKEILETPRYGCLNVHASLLPKYRGGAPIHQAIMDGEQETGITIMYMAEKLDAGDILTQEATPIAEEDDVGTMHDKLSAIGAKLIIATLEGVASGDIQGKPQDEREAIFASNITREREKLDWTKSAKALFNQVRGLRPWPVAYTELHGKRLKVWEAVAFNQQAPTSASPGEVIRVDGKGVVVACGENTALVLTLVQPAGKKKMPVSQFVQGSQRLAVGTRLGAANE